MQVYGNIATPVEQRKGVQTQKEFYTFRLAENQGKEENNTRTTTWYEVTAFISELEADLLSKGQFVKITGRLEAQAFAKRDGSPGAALKLVTGSIKPWVKGENADQNSQS
jgi:single-stranded DNA-binding protein